MEINKEELVSIIKEASRDVFIARQEHHDEHVKLKRIEHGSIDFLVASEKFVTAIKDAFWKTFIRLAVIAFFTASTGGFFLWFKYHK